MVEQTNQAKSIFLAAIDEHTREQWPAFVEEACAGDARLCDVKPLAELLAGDLD
jgi:hypothetical protein